MKDHFQSFVAELQGRLQSDLPAYAAHRKVMSDRRSVNDLQQQIKGARQSAVLILLYPHEEQLHTVFIQRSSYKGVHSGQISLPGGKFEPEDKDLQETALREAEEEVAVKASRVITLGSISPLYVPPSNFLINPYVGYHADRPRFIPEPTEVAGILETPLEVLIGDHRLRDQQIELKDGQKMDVKGFPIGDQLIWGATAMIVKEFAEIVEELRSPISLR